MPINASPHFERAQREYEQAQTTEQKIKCLKKMIALSPKHKGAENLNAQLKRRLAKLKYTKEKESKTGKSIHKGIKKDDMQAVIIGFTNTGKSSLLSLLTNTQLQIGEYKFTTKQPIIRMMKYAGTQIQLIENPAFDSEYYDKSLTNTTDTIIILVDRLDQIQKIQKNLDKTHGKQLIVFNKIDKLTEHEKRKISATLQSKKYNFMMISSKTKENIEELKSKIFRSFDKIRVYTKEPGKEKSPKPIILEPQSKIKDVAEKILKGFSQKIKETKIWGPSSKFSGQKVGLQHSLKDLDVVEFKTK
jgi:small GTP-binding protein